MKKLQFYFILIFTAVILCSVNENSFSQGFYPGKGMMQLDAGLGVSVWGVPVYVGMDFGVADQITIGPRVSYRSYNYGGFFDYGSNIINVTFRGDYHYSYHIDALPKELDLYGGLSAGYSIWSNKNDVIDPDGNSRAIVYVQAGARWYFSKAFAVNVEALGGNLSGLEVGISYRFK